MATVEMFGRLVGDGQPCLIISEVGINHNGSVDIARDLIFASAQAGADVVKFQKRTPHLAVPLERQSLLRESCCAEPGERITELEHRTRIELGQDAYKQIDYVCKLSRVVGPHGMNEPLHWFASPWDVPSVESLRVDERAGVQGRERRRRDGSMRNRAPHHA